MEHEGHLVSGWLLGDADTTAGAPSDGATAWSHMDACAVTQFVPGFLALAVDRIVYVTPLPSPEDADLGSLEPQLRRDAVCFIALFEVWPHSPPSTLHPPPGSSL